MWQSIINIVNISCALPPLKLAPSVPVFYISHPCVFRQTFHPLPTLAFPLYNPQTQPCCIFKTMKSSHFLEALLTVPRMVCPTQQCQKSEASAYTTSTNKKPLLALNYNTSSSFSCSIQYNYSKLLIRKQLFPFPTFALLGGHYIPSVLPGSR